MRKASEILYRFRGYILALFAIALLACPAAPFPQNYSRMVEVGPYVGTLLFYVLGIALRIRARQFIGQHTRSSTHEAAELVTDGPYAHMRHPRFFHIFIIAIAFFEYALARAEDRFLEEKFGDTWRAWAKKTPMSTANIEAFFCRNSGGSPKPATNKDFPETGCPKRTVFQAFKADASTWFWLVIVNLIIVLLKFHTV